MRSEHETCGAEQTIRLDQFLKLVGAVGTGGQAKMLIQEGGVKVNGEVEMRRARKLRLVDLVELEGASYRVERNQR
jgi:ribosome-associated protein